MHKPKKLQGARMKKGLAGLILVVMAGTATAAMATDAYVSVTFNSTLVFRRSPADAPKIGGGQEDYSVRISCMGMKDCQGHLSRIGRLMDGASVAKGGGCEGPASARIDFVSNAAGDTGSEQIDFYGDGKCFKRGGKHYIAQRSVFDILNKKPVHDW
jgi:hypothetical protein